MLKNTKEIEKYLGIPKGSIQKAIDSEDDIEIAIPEKKSDATSEDSEFDAEEENKKILPFANKHVVVDTHVAEEHKPQKRYNTGKLKLFKEDQVMDANYVMDHNKLDKGRVFKINIKKTEELHSKK